MKRIYFAGSVSANDWRNGLVMVWFIKEAVTELASLTIPDSLLTYEGR